MAILSSARWRVIAVALAAALGCAAPKRCGEGCGGGGLCSAVCSAYHGTLADDVMCCQRGCLSQAGNPCGPAPRARCGPECMTCRECCLVPLGLAGPIIEKPQPGPPPATFRPQMPPKFLAVPTHPIVSPVRPDAPEFTRGEVETTYRKELIIPGSD